MERIKVALQQRVIPSYRVPFFEELARREEIELRLFAGLPRENEMIPAVKSIPSLDFSCTNNIHLLSGKLYACLQPALLPWLQRTGPDVVILEANPRYLTSRWAMKWIKNRAIGLIGWGLGAPQRKSAALQNKARHAFLSQFDALIAYSKLGKAQYISQGMAEENVYVAPNSSVARPDYPIPERPKEFTDGKATVLFVGRLQTRKRIDSLIRACSQLPAGLQPNLWIAGDGPEMDVLKSFAQIHYPQTIFRGALYGSALEALFRKADVFVLPGTGGLAMQQAMAHGLPVIVAEGDGTQSNMLTRENGWEIPAQNDQALLAALRDALSDSRKLRRMGEAAFITISSDVNINVMADVFIQAILDVRRKKATDE